MRKVIDSSFGGQYEWWGRFQPYYTGLGAGNYIDRMLANEGLVYANIAAQVPIAKGNNDLKIQNSGKFHKEIELRDNKKKLPLNHMLGGAQNLKSLFPSNKMILVDWGLPIQVGGKMKYPSKFEDMYAIWQAYFAKDATYGVGLSPIAPYNTQNDIVMATDNTAMLAANTHNTDAFTFDGISMDNTDLRNTNWEPVLHFMVLVYNLIKSTYKNAERELGLAGFQVAASAPGHKDQKSKALQESHVQITGAIIGSVAYNNNPFDCWYIKGQDLSGTKIPFPKNSAIAVTSKMSRFILGNDNALEIAKFVVTVRK